MKKILLISLTPFFGGGEVYLAALARFLKNEGHQVFIYCASKKLADDVLSQGMQVRVFERNSYLSYFANLARIIRWIRTEKINHVHLNGNRELFFAPVLKFFFGISTTATKHTYPYPHNKLINKLRNWLIIKCIHATTMTICVSRGLKNKLASLGTRPELLKIIRNVPNQRFLNFSATTLRPVHVASKINLLMLARLEVMKGYRDLCDACREMDNVQLTFVGGGPNEDLLRYGKREQLRYLGHLDDPIDEIAKADIVVLPSYSEGGCPLALLESMAMAKPIIASSIPTIQELVRDHIDGFLVSPGKIADLKIAIAMLVADKSLREKMGAQAKQRIVEEFSSQYWQQANREVFST